MLGILDLCGSKTALLLAAFAVLSACGEGTAPVSVPPLAVARVTSPFGMRDHHPIHRNSGPVHHDGYDLAAPTGSPIFAARSGRVVDAGSRGGYGLTVEVDHGGGLSTRYAHASRLAVRTGQTLQGGEILGFVGSTGLSTGPHLHYEVRMNGKAIDPRDAGFALAADIRTGRVPRTRLASYDRAGAASVGNRVGSASVPNARKSRRVRVGSASVPAAKKSDPGPGGKPKATPADKLRTPREVVFRNGRDPMIAQIKLKSRAAIARYETRK